MLSLDRTQQATRRLEDICVAVTSDQSLVADSVSTAVACAGFQAQVVPWPDEARHEEQPHATACMPDALLMICEFDRPGLLRQAQVVASRWAVPSVLITGAPRGRMWGAMLAYGVDVILPPSTRVDQLAPVLVGLLDGTPLMPTALRDELLLEGLSLLQEQRVLTDRVNSLTAREREVLALLDLGEPVASIAHRCSVSQATVRSHVRAVLRKLDVHSQIEAVAVYQLVSREPLRTRRDR